MDIVFDLATPADDAGIRRLLATSPIPGNVTVTYEREPDYFAGCAVMGRCQTLVARERAGGEVVGVACRAVRTLFLNGQAEGIGYLGHLRLAARVRGQGLTSRGAEALRALHDAAPIAGYLAAITAENSGARRALIERRAAQLPTLRPLTDVRTIALILSMRLVPRLAGDVTRATQEDLPAIIAFLQRRGRDKQFFPVYHAEDFNSSTTQGFAVEDFVIARQKNEIVGVMGLWDQSAYKQTVAQSYNGMLRVLRPVYNQAARLAEAAPLPHPGEPIRSAYASFICIAGDQPDIFRALLQHVMRLAAMRGYAYLMLGFAANDPLLAEANRYPHITYRSRLYTASWDEGTFHEQLDQRICYVDIATF